MFENLKLKNDYSIHIPVHIVFYIRNYYDYSSYHSEELPIQYFTANNYEYLHAKLIKISELINEKKFLIKNNKCVFGVYFRIYKYNNKVHFKNELASVLFDETEKKKLKVETFYEWKIYNWSDIIKYKSKSSPEFSLYGHKWKLTLYPNGFNETSKDYISLFLNCCDSDKNEIYAKFTLFIRNFDDPECCFYNWYDASFEDEHYCWGHSNFIERKMLLLKNKSAKKKIIKKNKCVVGVYIQIFEEEKIDTEDLDLLINLIRLENEIKTKDEIDKTKDKINEIKTIEDKEEERENIRRELRGEIESELIEKLESDLREEIEQELREEIEEEIKKKIEDEFEEKKEKIEKDLRLTVEKEIYEKITKENPQYSPYSPYYPYPPFYYSQNIPGYTSPAVSPNQQASVIYNYPPSTTAAYPGYSPQPAPVDPNYPQATSSPVMGTTIPFTSP